ncbi:phosphatase PAP2 family protein [Terrihabitans sp. B22-R8]|uniref:phosphatase PAP2 family protein n=1 Tax=Terrihabitans sp. B22-R8 TaxID=3425128 RepID=UPI00403CB5A8
MPITARLAAVIGLLVALLCALNASLDVSITALFYDPALRDFPLDDSAWVRGVRWSLMHLPHAITIVAVLALVGHRFKWRIARHLPSRQALFLLSTLIVVPGLVVNGGLKENWGRPRPAESAMFGGTTNFWPWWKPGGPCEGNCSFVSGEVSAVAWTAAAASLAPPQIRPFAIGAAVTLTAATAFLRVAFGRHWFSDVVISASLTLILIAGMHRLFFGPSLLIRRRKPAIAAQAQVVDAV